MAETKGDKGAKADKGAKSGKTDKPAAKGAGKLEAGAKDAKGKPQARKEGGAEIAAAGAVKSAPKDYVARLKKLYRDEIVPKLTKEFGYKNALEVPKLEKIVLNMGLGAAVTNPKIIDAAVEEVKAITGQKPVVTRSKKAIASFKLRAGIPIGVMVTLRKERMWEFLDRLVSIALPRTRDFRGVSRKAFDGKGNYTLGLKEQIIFPEINYDRIDVIKGLNISFVTTAKTDEEGRALLAHLGMPFRAA
jgi:large subunit ribosomal protein L5